MMKAFSFFAFLFTGTSILVATMSGGGGLKSTYLNGNITDTETTIIVDSNVGFSDTGIIWIGYEQIHYSGLTGVTQIDVDIRGYNNTDAIAHSTDEPVRAEDNAVLNSIFGFNVGQLVDSWGLFAFPIVFVRFFSQTVPYMIQGNMGDLFQGNGLGIIVDLWLVFGAGFVFMLVMALISARRQ
jgi:hypothetical protein